MSQVKKEDVRDRLLGGAKQEFLKQGFQNASLRAIAKSADVSLANIYSYAKNKDALFEAVLSGLVKDFDKTTDRFKSFNHESNDFAELEVERELMKAGVAYAHKHRLELHLLLNLSGGSSLENYPERVIEGYVENCKRFLSRLKKHNKKLVFKEPSEFFFKNYARLVLRAIAEAVKGDISMHKMLELGDEIVRYNFHGFRGLAEVTYKKEKR